MPHIANAHTTLLRQWHIDVICYAGASKRKAPYGWLHGLEHGIGHVEPQHDDGICACAPCNEFRRVRHVLGLGIKLHAGFAVESVDAAQERLGQRRHTVGNDYKRQGCLIHVAFDESHAPTLRQQRDGVEHGDVETRRLTNALMPAGISNTLLSQTIFTKVSHFLRISRMGHAIIGSGERQGSTFAHNYHHLPCQCFALLLFCGCARCSRISMTCSNRHYRMLWC